MDYLIAVVPILILVLSFLEFNQGNITVAMCAAMLGIAGMFLIIIGLLIDIRNYLEKTHQKDK